MLLIMLQQILIDVDSVTTFFHILHPVDHVKGMDDLVPTMSKYAMDTNSVSFDEARSAVDWS